MVPRGVSLDETPGHAEAGTVVNSEQQGLFVGGGPPLVDRAVMLPEFADIGAAETPVSARLALGLWNQVGEMLFDV